jgi:pimeloyl-ACP methyl ester carboxylesterase
MPKTAKSAADYILPLNINGLEGRMLHLPDTKKYGRETLFIYGQHSSLERWWGLAQAFNDVGAVTMPDIPGFGGMTSLYKIGLDASIDNLADYLAAFIKLRYKRKKVTIVGMSLGFIIVTRVLQKYPDLTVKIEDLISVVGFAHKDDFKFSKRRYWAYRTATYIFSKRVTALIYQAIFTRPILLRVAYARTFNAREKFANKSGDEFKETMDMEIRLWKINDIRTQMKTGHEMLTLDNTKKQIDLPLRQIASKNDRYFNHVKTEESLRKVFSDFKLYYTKDPNHAPTIIADKKAASPFIPPKLKGELRQASRKRK